MVQSLAFKATYFLILFLALCWCLCWLDHSHWMKQKEHSSLWQTNRNLQNKWIAKTSDKNNTHIYIYMFNSLPEFRFQDPFCFLSFFCFVFFSDCAMTLVTRHEELPRRRLSEAPSGAEPRRAHPKELLQRWFS